jgi:solute carrier family 25, member 34/35
MAQQPHAGAAPPRLNLAGSVLASAAAASAAVLVTNVPETVKTRLQLDGEGAKRGAPRQYSGIVDAFTKIWRLEGVRGLQSGLSAGVGYQCVMNGSRLGLYEPIQAALRGATGADEHSWALKIASAATSGAVGATLGSPLYLIKSRLQAQSPHFRAAEQHSYAGLADGLRQVYRAEGVRGLFRGVDGALPRVMAGSATQLSTYDAAKRFATASLALREGSHTQFFVASLLASVVTVTVMNPLDVISTR